MSVVRPSRNEQILMVARAVARDSKCGRYTEVAVSCDEMMSRKQRGKETETFARLRAFAWSVCDSSGEGKTTRYESLANQRSSEFLSFFYPLPPSTSALRGLSHVIAVKHQERGYYKIFYSIVTTHWGKWKHLQSRYTIMCRLFIDKAA